MIITKHKTYNVHEQSNNNSSSKTSPALVYEWKSWAEQSSCQKAQSVNKIPAKLPLNPYYKQRESARLREWENFTRTRWINETEQRKRGRCRERSKWAALLNDFSMCQFIILIFFSISFSIINCRAKCLQSNKKKLRFIYAVRGNWLCDLAPKKKIVGTFSATLIEKVLYEI